MYAGSISLWKESGPLLKSDPILTLETMFDPYFMSLSCALAWLSICRSQTCHDQTIYHHLEIYLHDKPLSHVAGSVWWTHTKIWADCNNSDTKNG